MFRFNRSVRWVSVDGWEVQCLCWVLFMSYSLLALTVEYFPFLVLMKDRCKLFCRVAGTMSYYQLQDRVIDGTPCGPDTYDICVQGLCRVPYMFSSCRLPGGYCCLCLLQCINHMSVLYFFSKRVVITFWTPRPGMTSAECAEGTTPPVGLSPAHLTMHNMVIRWIRFGFNSWHLLLLLLLLIPCN